MFSTATVSWSIYINMINISLVCVCVIRYKTMITHRIAFINIGPELMDIYFVLGDNSRSDSRTYKKEINVNHNTVDTCLSENCVNALHNFIPYFTCSLLNLG